MGAILLLGGLALLLFFTFIFDKKERFLAVTALIPTIPLIILLFVASTKENDYEKFYARYHLYQQVNFEEIEDDSAKLIFIEEINEINSQLIRLQDACNCWFAGFLFDKRYLELKLITINYD